MTDPNHPIALASRVLAKRIEAQKGRGGPNYHEWEDNIEDAIAALAFALVDEIVERMKDQ